MQKVHPGHKFSSKERTTDVVTEEQVDFESLLLSPLVIKGLTDSGFEKPSPIQLKAIPLGRCGLDLIAQAKSGTGKTCVFSVIALESINTESHAIQVLILAPTREIAVQIKDVVNAIGCHIKGLSCQVFIGGLPVEEDKKTLKTCHIAVGSPGRIKSLIENSHFKTDSIRMFILDEADKLLDDNFQEQINWIYSTLPANKQMMAFSATYPEYLANHLTRYMREPTFVRLSASDPTLQGIKQFYCVIPFHNLPHKVFQEKVDHLLKLLSKVNFHQCLLFSNYQIRAQNLSSTLCAKGWPATFIAGSQAQHKRLEAIEKLKEFKCRILISTDLTARGIDAENVNLVVNMDIPRDGETYLHRIGRAGRFGTKGIAVTFVARGKEEKHLMEIEKSIGIRMEPLPDDVPESLMVSDCQGLLKDTVEVNAIHKNSVSENNCDSEKITNIEVQDIVDDRDSQSIASSEAVKGSTHCRFITTNNKGCRKTQQHIKKALDNVTKELSGDDKIDDKCKDVSLENTSCSHIDNKAEHSTTQQSLISDVEFDKDFEEYLALSTKPENINANCSHIDNKTEQLTTQQSLLSDVEFDKDFEEYLPLSTKPENINTNCSHIDNKTEQSTTQQCKQSLLSDVEFDKDFEEYLALSTKPENMGREENGVGSSSDINENIYNYSCDKQDTTVLHNVGQHELKTVDNINTSTECSNVREENTLDNHHNGDGTCTSFGDKDSHKIKHRNDALHGHEHSVNSSENDGKSCEKKEFGSESDGQSCKKEEFGSESDGQSCEKEEFGTDDDCEDSDGGDGRDDYDNIDEKESYESENDGKSFEKEEFGSESDGQSCEKEEFGTDDDCEDSDGGDGRDDYDNIDEKESDVFGHLYENKFNLMSGNSCEKEEFGTDDDDREDSDGDDGRDDYDNINEKESDVFGHFYENKMSGKKYSENSTSSQIDKDKDDGHHKTTRQSSQVREDGISFSNGMKCSYEDGTFGMPNGMPIHEQIINDSKVAPNESSYSARSTRCDHRDKDGMMSHHYTNYGNPWKSVDNSGSYYMYGVNGIPIWLNSNLNFQQATVYQVCNQRDNKPGHDEEWSDVWFNAFHSINHTITHFAKKNTKAAFM